MACLTQFAKGKLISEALKFLGISGSLRQTFIALYMFQVNQSEIIIGHTGKAFDAQGELSDETSRKLISKHMENLANLIGQLKSGQD